MQLGSNCGRAALTWRHIDWKVIAAAFTSFISLFVGASGPLVAAFIKQIHRDRFTTIATFSTAMALQHAPKALIFGLTGFMLSDWLVLIVAMIGCGFIGTWLGLRLLKAFSDQRFGRVLNLLLTALALRLLWQAAAAGAWWQRIFAGFRRLAPQPQPPDFGRGLWPCMSPHLPGP